MKMTGKKIFEDNSSIEWESKESLKYTENGFSASIWFDLEKGFFSNKRIIISSQILKWEEYPKGASDCIDEKKRQEIIGKIKRFHKCREESPEEREEREKREKKIAEYANKTVFKDGSSIEPINREYIKYAEEGFSTVVKISHKHGKCFIKSSSILKWSSWPEGTSEFINENKRNDIIQKIKRYYKPQKCHVE